MDISVEEEQERTPHLLCISDVFGPSNQQLNYACPHWWGLIFFSQSDSNANLFQKCLHRHTRNDVLPALWTSLSPVKLTHKINHHLYLYLYSIYTFPSFAIDAWVNRYICVYIYVYVYIYIYAVDICYRYSNFNFCFKTQCAKYIHV